MASILLQTRGSPISLLIHCRVRVASAVASIFVQTRGSQRSLLKQCRVRVASAVRIYTNYEVTEISPKTVSKVSVASTFIQTRGSQRSFVKHCSQIIWIIWLAAPLHRCELLLQAKSWTNSVGPLYHLYQSSLWGRSEAKKRGPLCMFLFRDFLHLQGFFLSCGRVSAHLYAVNFSSPLSHPLSPKPPCLPLC